MRNILKKGLILLMMLSTIVTCSFITASADELEKDKKTGLATPESVWNNYIDNTKDIVENDTEINKWMSKNDAPVFLKQYLNFSDKNTEDEWKEFSDFEKFNYIFFNVDIKSSLHNRSFKDEDDFWDEFSYEKISAENSCKTSTNIDAFFTEIEKVARWQYQYYEKTNNTYDFFAGSEEEVTTENLEDDSEYQDIKKELSSEEETEKVTEKSEGFSMGRLLKNNILTIIIMIIVIVGLVVIFLKKKKDE